MAPKKEKASKKKSVASSKAAPKPAAGKTLEKATPAPAPVARTLAPRPLSPHLSIYRPQITSVLSITHRASGAFLVLGTFALSIWLLAAAYGQESYNLVMVFFDSIVGKFILLGWLAAFYFHLLNGVRHLFWDIGYGFNLKTMELTGYAVVLGTAGLTLATWLGALL